MSIRARRSAATKRVCGGRLDVATYVHDGDDRDHPGHEREQRPPVREPDVCPEGEHDAGRHAGDRQDHQHHEHATEAPRQDAPGACPIFGRCPERRSGGRIPSLPGSTLTPVTGSWSTTVSAYLPDPKVRSTLPTSPAVSSSTAASPDGKPMTRGTGHKPGAAETAQVTWRSSRICSASSSSFSNQ